MLTCEQALELISAQLDGALTAEEAGALDEHLAQCPACRALRADLSTLHQLLPTLAEEPPAGLKDNIMKAVHASKCTPFHTRKRQWRWRSWASLAAVLVLVLVGGQAVHLWSPPDNSGSVPRANLAGLTGAASGGSAGQTAPAQEDRAGPTGEPAEAASGGADGAIRKDSSAGERPQNRDVTPPADGPEGGQIPASAQEPSVSAPPVSELQPTPSAGPSVMSLMPEDAPQDTQPPLLRPDGGGRTPGAAGVAGPARHASDLPWPVGGRDGLPLPDGGRGSLLRPSGRESHHCGTLLTCTRGRCYRPRVFIRLRHIESVSPLGSGPKLVSRRTFPPPLPRANFPPADCGGVFCAIFLKFQLYLRLI